LCRAIAFTPAPSQAFPDRITRLPGDLRNIFGQLQGIEMDVKVGRPLVGADGTVVRKKLETQGWYIWPEASATGC